MFISCGDILVDLFNQPAEASAPGKVALQGHVGGSPFNVAIGLARLGNQSGFLCKNSTDFMGQQISAYIDSNGILSDWVLPSDLNSTLAMIKKNPDGSANYAFYLDNTADTSMEVEELPEHFPDALDALHFGSYSTAVGSTSKALKALALREAQRRVISYDPNLRASVQPDLEVWRETFSVFTSVADFVKASDEDIRTLLGADISLSSFAADTIAKGAKIVVVTEGHGGATLYSADGRQYKSKRLSINVADTVGAGDTFQAGSLHWLKANGCMQAGELNIVDADLQACVNFAAVAAAITCTRHGADLPTLQEVEAGLESL